MSWLQSSRGSLSCWSLFLITGSVLGFRFGFQDTSSVARPKGHGAIPEDEARVPNLASELEERLQGFSIQPEQEESSCYSRIFGALTNKEKNTSPEPSLCSVLGRSEAHRTAFAARLTICELETNRLTLPRECTLWIEAGSGPTSTKLQACVGALHASPQSWSSFTGHQREAVQLCFAHHKLQGIELATSLNLKTIKFSTDMIRLGRLDHRSHQEDLRKLKDHMRSVLDQSLQNLDLISEQNRQDSQRIFHELEARFQDVKNHLHERNEQMWKAFNAQQNQQIVTMHDSFRSLNEDHDLKMNENINNFLQSMKEEVEQKIKSSLDFASTGMIENLKQAFEDESRSNSANVNHRIEQAFEVALKLATSRHHQALEESIALQSKRMSVLYSELLSLDNVLSSMKENLDSIRISSNDREIIIRESSAKIEEQQRKGEELINRFMESMASHQAMIQNLSDSVSTSPLFISYSFFKRGDGLLSSMLAAIYKTLSFSKLKTILGWLIWFTWMSGGMNWMVRVGLLKAAMLCFFITVQMPFRWLRYMRDSKTTTRQRLSKDSQPTDEVKSINRPHDPRNLISSDDQLNQCSRQVFICPHSEHRQVDVRRKWSSQSLGGSRIVPTRLIGNRSDNGS
ncbi:hypothetical protein MJO28_000776 [Puccinia striiformis f. sp. tritici]|uniref:Uncharacterized protein n=1 Tax=Puccinia striiformis f. sp. tritici TaxID=168172 RepID=A0ACC0EZ76_9BASI|nr:hypothetical protein MJO28_000776 [Puccinia striiformis f. sp. tritici]